MKKSLLLIPLLFIGSFTIAANDFPKFPMTMNGNVKIGSTDVDGGTLKIYNSSNQELTSYNITQKGKYGSDNVDVLPLLLNEFAGSLTIKLNYGGKTYVVDSIDDSNRGDGCPRGSAITFVSNDCRYDIVFKQETSNGGSSSQGSSSSSSGKGSSSKNTGGSSSTTTTAQAGAETNVQKNDVSVENNKENNNKSVGTNEKIVTSTNNQAKSAKSFRYMQGDQSAILGDGYTKEQYNAYRFAYANGLTNKRNIYQANMNGKLTRIAMAKILSNYAVNVLGQIPDVSKGAVEFSDVSKDMNKKYDNAVTLAYQLGIMGQNMKKNKFRPYDEVTRAEFVTALSRMLYGISDGTGKTKYYEPHMAKLYNEGIITKKNSSVKEKRGYVMIMLMRSVMD